MNLKNKIKAVKDPNTTLEELIAIAKLPSNVEVKMHLLERANLAPEILEIIANSKSKDLLEMVADNPNTPSSVLHKLAQHKSIVARYNVAKNANTSINTLQILLKDDCAGIARKVKQILEDKAINHSSIPL